MSIAMVQDFPPQDGETATTNYDAIHAAIMEKVSEPTGLIIHTAGFVDDRFRIFEVWESREQCESFLQEVVMPTVMEITRGSPAPPPTTTIYELHSVLHPAIASAHDRMS